VGICAGVSESSEGDQKVHSLVPVFVHLLDVTPAYESVKRLRRASLSFSSERKKNILNQPRGRRSLSPMLFTSQLFLNEIERISSQ
jgi:hypothetical protein